MCQFESYYFENDGYVIRCKKCGSFQLAFGNVILSLTDKQFEDFYRKVKKHCNETDMSLSEHCKSVTIRTPHFGFCLVLTRKEVARLSEILEIVDVELKVNSLLKLFR